MLVSIVVYLASGNPAARFSIQRRINVFGLLFHCIIPSVKYVLAINLETVDYSFGSIA